MTVGPTSNGTSNRSANGDPANADPPARPPSIAAVAIALVPCTAICFSVVLWDRIYPFVLGLPFNIFWLMFWILLTPPIMWQAYRIERRRDAEAGKRDEARRDG